MPLEYQLLEVPLGKLNTREDPASVELGTLVVAENLSSQVGEAYVKRFGYNSLANTLTDLRQLATFDTPGTQTMANSQELLAVDGAKLKAYDPQRAVWTERSGPTANCIAGESPVNFNQAEAMSQGVSCYLPGTNRIVHVWTTLSGTASWVVFQTEDATTGAVIVGPTRVVNALPILRVVTNGTDVVVLGLAVGAQTLTAYAITGGLISGGATVIFSGAFIHPIAAIFDAVYDGANIVIGYVTAAPQIAVAVVSFTSFAVGGNVVQSAELPASLAVHSVTGEFGEVIYGRTAAATTVSRTFTPATGAPVAGPFTLDAAFSATLVDSVRVSSTQILALWSGSQGLSVRTVTSAGALGTALTLPNATFCSRSWTYGGAYFVAAYVPRLVGFPSSIVLRVDTAPAVFNDVFQPVAMHAYKAIRRGFDRPSQVATGVFRWDAQVLYSVGAISDVVAISNLKVDFTDSSIGKAVDSGQGPVFAGGVSLRYDGVTLGESNYLQYPEITAVASVPIGAGGLNNGTYQYVATYESVDIAGNVDRSETSEPVSITGAAGAGLNRFQVDVRMLMFTRFGDNQGQRGGKVVLWRNTQANPTVFQRLSLGPSLSMTGATADIIDSTVASSKFLDFTPDAQVAAAQLLYTDSGALDREPPMPSKALVVHRNRVWGISSLDPRMFFYSGELTPGEAPWFSSAQRFRLDVGGGCTALASLDDKLVIFKQDRIFFVSGDPPNQTGQGGSLSMPTLVTADCGCIEPLSVVTTPQGVMFLSQKGIHTLTRSLETQYHGEIDGILETYPTCNAATLVQHSREVRFELSNASGFSSAAVYNYRDDRWTTHVYAYTFGAGYARTALNFGGVYAFGLSSNLVAKESLTTYLDNGLFVPMQLQTAWIRPAGKQGFVRCKEVGFLGVLNTAHDLYLQVGKDYTESFPMSASWTAAQLAALPLEQVFFHLPQQKGEAFHLWLYDLQGAGTLGTGQGVTIRGFQLRVAAKRGSFEKGSPAGAKG